MLTLDEYIQAIKNKNKIRVKFYSKKDNNTVERICAPMDYGPSRRTRNKSDRYHLWDFDGQEKQHILSLLPEQINDIEVLKEHFDPGDFIDWNVADNPWFIERDWSNYS